MKSEKNVGNWGGAILWTAGAAILGFGLYKLLRINNAEDEDSPNSTGISAGRFAETPYTSKPHPYYDPSHQRHQDAYIPKNQATDHRTHVGNGPGERNQIGGRASGKKARY